MAISHKAQITRVKAVHLGGADVVCFAFIDRFEMIPFVAYYWKRIELIERNIDSKIGLWFFNHKTIMINNKVVINNPRTKTPKITTRKTPPHWKSFCEALFIAIDCSFNHKVYLLWYLISLITTSKNC